tara:strand:+ start:4081 stop:5199 length:1119 start_codon:yes stop_codon:yes gene_type:complete
MIKVKSSILVISLCMIFVFGLSLGYLGSEFTESELILINNEKKILSNSIDNESIKNLKIDNYINFNNESEIYEKRTELLNFIWNDDNLPDILPNSVQNDFEDSRFDNLENLKKIEKLEIIMKHEIKSYPYIFFPEQSNGNLILFHQGHSGGFINSKSTIQSFLNSGFTVAAFSMPLIGMNNQPLVEIEHLGHVKIFKHDQLILLETEDFTSMNYFFTPVNTTLNYLEKNYSFEEFHMIGISGGGWVTTVYPAIDTRITKSFSVAGSLPLSLRIISDDVGDFEQYNPNFYSISNYFELYVMSSFGENREFTQIFNKYDPCCFAGEISKIYHDQMNEYVSNLSSGSFKIIIDDSHSEHKISDKMISLIIDQTLS